MLGECNTATRTTEKALGGGSSHMMTPIATTVERVPVRHVLRSAGGRGGAQLHGHRHAQRCGVVRVGGDAARHRACARAVTYGLFSVVWMPRCKRSESQVVQHMQPG